MVGEETHFTGSVNVIDLDAYHDFVHAKNASTHFGCEIYEFKRQLEKSENVDEDYKNFFLCILTVEERFESLKKQREKDDDVNELEEFRKQLEVSDSVDEDYKDCLLSILNKDERFQSRKTRREKDHDVIELDDDCDTEENDPHYVLLLKKLKSHEKSYILEDEKDGLPLVTKYEGDTSLDNHGEPEPGRKLRSAMKQTNRLSIKMPGVLNQLKHDPQTTSVKRTKNLIHKTVRKKAKRKKVEAVKSLKNGMVPDPDYLTFHQGVKIVDGHYVYANGDQIVAYEKKVEENDQEKEKDDDESSFDIEIIDSSTFYKKNKLSSQNLGGPKMQFEFRQQVIILLRKPYEEEEYDRLLQEIEARKQEARNLDLRGGRERWYSTNKDGKSYLDYYPDLKAQLIEFQDDRMKLLNLLRGFFFWIQNFLQIGSFYPWLDEECLAICPGSS